MSVDIGKPKEGIPWNKGIKIDRNKYPNFGHFRKHTEESKKKMSEKRNKLIKEGKIEMWNKGNSDYYKGEKNPFYGKKHTKETKKKLSESWDYNKHFKEETRKKLKENNIKYWLGKKRSLDSIKKRTETRKKNGFWKDKESLIKKHSGERCIFWNGGISFEPYTPEFTKEFRNKIRQRDNQICMNCKIHREKLKQSLSIHHINYDKKLTIPQNCISLCKSCHALTNINRKYWINLFQEKLFKLYNYQYDNLNNIIMEINNDKHN